MKASELILDEVDKGLAGAYDGIRVQSMPMLSEDLGGIQPGRYDLIGGNTGTGKTAFVDWFYILAPLAELYREDTDEDFDLNVLYFSMEIPMKRKLAKWMCLWLYIKYGIVMDFKQLLSFNKKRLDPEIYNLVRMELPFFDWILDKVHFIEGTRNPISIKIYVDNFAEDNGKKIYYDSKNPDKKLYQWSDVEGRKDVMNWRAKYVPNDEKKIVQVVTDHIGLMRTMKDHNKKATLDVHSANCVEYRNLYNYSPINVSQFNRDLADIQRKKHAELTPQIEDFKETGNTQEDADTVIALFNPARYNLPSYRRWQVTRLRNRFRSLTVLKNRNGEDNMMFGMRFIGENGHFAELPSGQAMADNARYYDVAMDLENRIIPRLDG